MPYYYVGVTQKQVFVSYGEVMVEADSEIEASNLVYDGQFDQFAVTEYGDERYEDSLEDWHFDPMGTLEEAEGD